MSGGGTTTTGQYPKARASSFGTMLNVMFLSLDLAANCLPFPFVHISTHAGMDMSQNIAGSDSEFICWSVIWARVILSYTSIYCKEHISYTYLWMKHISYTSIYCLVFTRKQLSDQRCLLISAHLLTLMRIKMTAMMTPCWRSVCARLGCNAKSRCDHKVPRCTC